MSKNPENTVINNDYARQRNVKFIRKSFSWPEWNDAEFNAEKWESLIPKGQKEPRKERKHSLLGFSLYEDPDGLIILPSSLKVAKWKRISELFSEEEKEPPTIIPENDGDFEFIKPNLHLFESELMRTLIGQMLNLMELNKVRPIIPETIDHILNPTESTPWRPWHHVYSNCKAGKIPHKPVYNGYGKFVVRLYCMGFWRKFMIDDWIPLDAQNRILLPVTGNKNEIWSLILFKAFLKIASLEYLNVYSTEIETFNAITALTGWIPEHRQICKSLPEDLWSVLSRCLPKYSWPGRDKHLDMIESAKSKKSKKSVDSRRAASKGSRAAMKHAVSSQPTVVQGSSDMIYNPNLVMCVIVHFHKKETLPMTNAELEEIDGILKNYNMCMSLSHTAFLTQIRDCPLEPPPINTAIPRYKLIRRELWDPDYLVTKKVIHEKIECIGVQPVTSWLQYQKYAQPDNRDPLEDHKHRPVSKVLKTLADYMANPDEHLPVLKDPSKSFGSESTSEEKNLWFDLKDFCKCFRRITIFHNVRAYNYYYKAVDRMSLTEHLVKEKIYSKNGKGFHQTLPLQTETPMFLLSDFISSKMLFLCIATINDLYLEMDKSEIEGNESDFSGRTSILSGIPRKAEIRFCGFLQVEEYSFKTLMHNFVVHTLKSAYCKAIAITLPPGRVVFRMTTSSNNGCVLHIWSSSQIIYGEEEMILPKLTTESLRFSQTAEEIFSLLKECLICFDDPVAFHMAIMKLRSAMFPDPKAQSLSKVEMTQIFNSVFYSLLEINIDRNYEKDIFFVARCFTLDATTHEIFQFVKYSKFKLGQRRQSSVSQNINQLRKGRYKSSKRISKDTIDTSPVEFQLFERYYSTDKLAKIKLIQSLVRRHIAIRILDSRKAGTKLNAFVSSYLEKILGLIEKTPEENANYFLRSLMQLAPTCSNVFPFCQDENHRLAYQEFSGVIPAMSPNSWNVVFRDVFFCRKDVELVPRLYTDHPSCMVTIVNNDNLEVTPTLFLKPQHHNYAPNNGGYTILVEAASKEVVLPECKWKLLMLTVPGAEINYASDEVLGSFSPSMKEVVEYFVPNKDNIVTRYNMNCFADCLLSLQFFTSNPKVFFTVNLYRNEELIQTITKKGNVVFPAVLMKLDETSDQRSMLSKIHDQDSTKLQLEVKLLHDSWLVSPDDINFINDLQMKEREQLITEEVSLRMSISSMVEKSGQKKLKGKSPPETKVEDIVPESIDVTKPHYTIRVVVDTALMEYVEVKKDTGFFEDIRAIKRAWEDAEPGRANRALESRRAFLLKYMNLPPVEEDPDNFRRAFDYRLASDIHKKRRKSSSMKGSEETASAEISSTLEVLPLHPITLIPLKPLDIQRFIRPASVQTLEVTQEALHLKNRQLLIQEYQQRRSKYCSRKKCALDIRQTEKDVLNATAENHLTEVMQKRQACLEFHQAFLRCKNLTSSRTPTRKGSILST